MLRLVADFADDKVCLEKPCGIAGFASQICTAFRKNITGPLKRSSWELWVEPGRFVSSFTTYILLKVHSAGEGFVKVNGGINLVGSASFDYEYFPIVNISNPSTQTQKAIIYGPLCDPDDHWGKRYYGRKCKPGDILAVMHQGAYTYSTAWRWQQPTAAYAALRGKKLALVKRQENFEDRYSGCKF